MIPALRADSLTRRFGSADGEVIALDAVDLDLHPAQFVSVLGPSGCGKSTLLNLLGLLDRPSSGRLEIAGIDVLALDDRETGAMRRANIGFLFQDAGLIDRMSVLDNVLLPLHYRNRPRIAAMAQARLAIAELGLDHRSSALVDTLSGGERQRVGLARILAIRPRLIVCDEPTASLDEANSLLMIKHLMACAGEGALVICASHDPLVLARAHLRLAMSRGQIVGMDGAA